MSNTDSWAKRSESHRYSQDDRAKQWKFEKELATKVEPFIDDAKQNSLVVGKFNLDAEPWRMAAVVSFRKYQLKILEKASKETMNNPVTGKPMEVTYTEITLVKQKLSRVSK